MPTAAIPRWIWVSFLIGLGYGVPVRVLFGRGGTIPKGIEQHASLLAGVMSVAFLAVVPLAMGALMVLAEGRKHPVTWQKALFLPWLACLVTLLAAALGLLEGAICLFLASPLFLAMASAGGLGGWLWLRRTGTSRSPTPLAVVTLLPLAFGTAEARWEVPTETQVVRNVTVIDAPLEVVWRNVASVPRIQASELPRSFAHFIGLPRPIEATLSHPGVGGVRLASFERGLVFREVVTDWQPGRTIAFSIQAEHAPPEALDEHVVVGGAYFDVLDGRYTLRPLGPRQVEVTLTSTHRVSTSLNAYAGLWARVVMWDLQRVILHVVQARCEAQAGP